MDLMSETKRLNVVNLISSAGTSVQNSRFLAAMDGVRRVCRERSAERAFDLARRFEDVLLQFRATPADHLRSPALVSIALDRFIGEARSAVELASAPAEASPKDVARVEQSIGTLNQMYVASEQAISVRTMAPASFMPGAEVVVMNALRDVRAATEQANHVGERISMSTNDDQRRRDDEDRRRQQDQQREQQQRDDDRRRQQDDARQRQKH